MPPAPFIASVTAASSFRVQGHEDRSPVGHEEWRRTVLAHGKDLESVEKTLSGRAEVGTFESRFERCTRQRCSGQISSNPLGHEFAEGGSHTIS